jgi:hypothetical protein
VVVTEKEILTSITLGCLFTVMVYVILYWTFRIVVLRHTRHIDALKREKVDLQTIAGMLFHAESSDDYRLIHYTLETIARINPHVAFWREFADKMKSKVE